MAKDIKKLLDGRGEKSIAVGQFTGPPQLDASSGPGIALLLQEELRRVGVAVERRTNLGIKGEYKDVTDKDSEQLAVLLKVQLVDGTSRVVLELERGVKSNPEIAQLLGVTAPLPVKADFRERNRKIQERVDTPRAYIAGTRVSAAADSPFAVEVLVGGKPRAPKDDKGQAMVPIQRGEVYAVRLINNSGHEAAAQLTVDGLSMFAFSKLRDEKTGAPRYTHLVVPAGKAVLVQGWHRDNEVSDSFLVTHYARSAAAQLPSSGGVGTITVTFAASWPPSADPPADEPSGKSGDATGFGPPVKQKFQEVKRTVGVVRAAVSVRYTRCWTAWSPRTR
jgi:hypothetical protein